MEKPKHKALMEGMKGREKMAKETDGEMMMMCDKCGHKHMKGKHTK